MIEYEETTEEFENGTRTTKIPVPSDGKDSQDAKGNSESVRTEPTTLAASGGDAKRKGRGGTGMPKES